MSGGTIKSSLSFVRPISMHNAVPHDVRSRSLQTDRRWRALIVLCLGVLMIVVDSTIVNVALPSIRSDLVFSETSLVWVVNAYLLTFGGFLLLGGRLADVYGPRGTFLVGIIAFTSASLACGIATSRSTLLCARAVQGVGGAVVTAVALSLIMNMFPGKAERAKAMGIYGFVCSGGGSIGVLLGGLLTSVLNWHWIFLINLPIGIVVCFLCADLIPSSAGRRDSERLDVAGTVTLTSALLLALYAIIDGNEAGWASRQSISLLSGTAGLLLLFLGIESRARSPLIPLGLFRSRGISIINVVVVLWAVAMFAWFFISALYLQRVLGYDAMHVGFAFLPANLLTSVLSLGVSGRLVMRYGTKIPLTCGLLLAACGLTLFAGSSLHATMLADVLPGMLFLGMGAGIASNPLVIAVMSGVDSSVSGLASGLTNAAFVIGGALGLAILATAAAARTTYLLSQGAGETLALNAGYHVAFGIAVAACIAAAIGSITLIPAGKSLKAEDA
jgi:EmrB/QacA subfamily drug resistance transporter